MSTLLRSLLAMSIVSGGAPTVVNRAEGRAPEPTGAAVAQTTAVGSVLAPTATYITWKGLTWLVKEGSGLGPGPNNWRRENAWVDGAGYLHLRVDRTGDTWYCGGVATTRRLGFGTYQWHVEGRLDLLDPNVVSGLFGYAGPDGTKEIDVEYARWGIPNNDNAQFVVYPDSGSGYSKHRFNISLSGSATTSRYVWSDTKVSFWTMGGYQPFGATRNVLGSWVFEPSNPPVQIPQTAMPVVMNLWLLGGNPPADGQPYEIVIRDFREAIFLDGFEGA